MGPGEGSVLSVHALMKMYSIVKYVCTIIHVSYLGTCPAFEYLNLVENLRKDMNLDDPIF